MGIATHEPQFAIVRLCRESSSFRISEILPLPPIFQIAIIPPAESVPLTRTMPRFAVILLLLALFAAGCQTAARGPQPTVLVSASQPATPIKKFWSRTAQFVQPLMPDRSNRTVRSVESKEPIAADRSRPDILPISPSPHSLYTAGSIFPPPFLDFPSREALPSTADTTVADTSPAAEITPVAPVTLAAETQEKTASATIAFQKKQNPLQIQSGDSEPFKSLLREIAIMPPEKRNVDDARLAELLEAFREEVMHTDFEAEYLALLRRRILPEAAPLPFMEFGIGRRSNNNSVRNQEPEQDNDIYYDEPIVRHAPRNTPPITEEPVTTQNSMPAAAPVYPSLVQLPGVVPATVQTSFQAHSAGTASSALNLTGHGAGDWQTPTRAAVEQLRYAIEQTPNGRTVSNEMRLRMLEMLLGNNTESVRPMRSADKTVNDFMGHQVLGFAALLDDSIRDSRSRYVNAAYRFSEGLQELQNLCPIKLKNVTFVEDWLAYGQFIPRNAQEFYPGDDFLVYMEIENPLVRRIPDGFEVSVAISYEIRDEHANIVAREDRGKPSERSLSRKRDYALAFPGTIPTSFAPGQYQLRISVTDLNDDSMQFAEEQIPFRVAPSLAMGR